VSSCADALTVGDDLVEAASVAISLLVEQLIVLALAHTERSLAHSSGRAGAGISVVDQVSRADSADTVDQESVGEGSALSAHLGGVEGEALLAAASTVDQNFIGPAGRAGVAVGSGSGSSWADLTGAVDAAQTLDAAAGLGGSIVDLISSASPRANAELVGEEASQTVAVSGGRVVNCVDGAGHAVSVRNEVSLRADLTGS
jgi:hypothetical protein